MKNSRDMYVVTDKECFQPFATMQVTGKVYLHMH